MRQNTNVVPQSWVLNALNQPKKRIYVVSTEMNCRIEWSDQEVAIIKYEVLLFSSSLLFCLQVMNLNQSLFGTNGLIGVYFKEIEL